MKLEARVRVLLPTRRSAFEPEYRPNQRICTPLHSVIIRSCIITRGPAAHLPLYVMFMVFLVSLSAPRERTISRM